MFPSSCGRRLARLALHVPQLVPVIEVLAYLANSHFVLEICWSPVTVPTLILGASLLILHTGAPALKNTPLAPASTTYCSVEVCTPTGGNGIASSCCQLPKHTKFSVSGCVAASVVGIFCKVASNNNKFSLPLSIWACNPLSLACHFLCARLSFILVL